MEYSVGTWCLYPWFEEHGIACIHPDDLAEFKALRPDGKLFRIAGTEGDYVVLEHAGNRYWIRPPPIHPVPTPAFGYGESVWVVRGNREHRAVIREIQWHHGHGRPFFLLDVEGKRYSRRCWSEELRAACDLQGHQN